MWLNYQIQYQLDEKILDFFSSYIINISFFFLSFIKIKKFFTNHNSSIFWFFFNKLESFLWINYLCIILINFLGLEA